MPLETVSIVRVKISFAWARRRTRRSQKIARLWRTVRHNSRSASPSSEMYSKRAIGRRRTSSSRLQEALGTERQSFAKLRIQPCAKKSQNLRMSSFQAARRSEEHTSELQSLMRISHTVFCLKKKKN